MNKLKTLFFSTIIALSVAGIVFAWTNPSSNPPIGGGALYYSSRNVGVGMTNPGYPLDVNGIINATDFYKNGSPFMPGYWTLSGNDINNTNSGSVIIGGGTGKINVGTVDPIYNIAGEKFATYLPSMTGVKEETTGVIQLQRNEKGEMSYEIDFGKAEKGSDLWLVRKITDFGDNWDKLAVLLTPNFDGRVWYEKKPAENRLVIYSAPITQLPNYPITNLEVSYRLTAPRFDWKDWSNKSDTDAEGVKVPESNR